MTLVLIGVDPHKGSHTAFAIDQHESSLGELKVRSSKKQCDLLLDWASRFEQRRWAIESAGGLGYLLAQQLVAAGEDVVDVPPTLSARVRVLGSGKSSKNDPNDALSTAIAALRGTSLRPVVLDDHRAILRMVADRHHNLRQLHRHRTDRSFEWAEETPSLEPARQSPAQPRDAHRGPQPDPQRHAGPRLLPAQDRRR